MSMYWSDGLPRVCLCKYIHTDI